MQRDEMCERTSEFALRVIRLVAALPDDRVGNVLGKQILKSGTSIGANYREASRASSPRQFVSTLEIVQRETDETLYWIDLIDRANLLPAGKLDTLKKECDELLSIVTASIRTAKQNQK